MSTAAPLAPAPIIPLNERPIKNTIVLFDVDGTLSPARQVASPEMLHLLAALRRKVAIGYVGGSDLSKQQEQLGDNVTEIFDFCFPENGLMAFRLGTRLASESFIGWLGEEKYKKLASFCLRYIADIAAPQLPFMRGTFVEFRNGMINVSPVGRNASIKERDDFEAFDAKTGLRTKMVEALKKEFADYGLTFSIGGKISFDVFPNGWDKTYCLRHVEAEAERTNDGVKYETIHFFGDKIFQGGNDWEIGEDPRTTAHAVKNPGETMEILKKLFDL